MKKKEYIIQDILSKIYQNYYVTEKLPTQRALADFYQVSRYTIQEALQEMQEIGILIVVQGSGTFINNKWAKNPLIFNSMTRKPYSKIQSKLLSLEIIKPTSEDKILMNLNDNDLLWQFERIRIVNWAIEQYEISKLPFKLFPNLTSTHVEGSIQNFVENSGFRISHFVTNYKATSLSKTIAKLLFTKEKVAMQITNHAYLEDGTIYEISTIYSLDYSVQYIRPFDRDNFNLRNK